MLKRKGYWGNLSPTMIHVKTIIYLWYQPFVWDHDDVIKWKHFPRYWPFVRGIHRSPVNSAHKGQLRGASIFSLICAWINNWVNNGEAGDLRRHRSHYDVIVMMIINVNRPLRTATHQQEWWQMTCVPSIQWRFSKIGGCNTWKTSEDNRKLKSREISLFRRWISIIKSFWNYALSTMMILSCFVQNSKANWQLSNHLLGHGISRDLGVRCFPGGYPTQIQVRHFRMGQ